MNSAKNPDVESMVKALWQSQRLQQRQTARNALLIAIALCVLWIRVGYPALTATRDKVESVGERIESAAAAVAPDLDESPKAGEKIGPYVVTSPYGPRRAPCPGCSSNHAGVDVGLPHGAPQYVPDYPGQRVTVECFRYSYRGKVELGARFTTSYGITIRAIHLSKCHSGKANGGSVFGSTGTSGTGPHAHIETYRDGAIFAPPRSIVWWVVTGSKPQPLKSQGGEDD